MHQLVLASKDTAQAKCGEIFFLEHGVGLQDQPVTSWASDITCEDCITAESWPPEPDKEAKKRGIETTKAKARKAELAQRKADADAVLAAQRVAADSAAAEAADEDSADDGHDTPGPGGDAAARGEGEEAPESAVQHSERDTEAPGVDGQPASCGADSGSDDDCGIDPSGPAVDGPEPEAVDGDPRQETRGVDRADTCPQQTNEAVEQVDSGSSRPDPAEAASAAKPTRASELTAPIVVNHVPIVMTKSGTILVLDHESDIPGVFAFDDDAWCVDATIEVRPNRRHGE